jgi:hypothetical protein
MIPKIFKNNWKKYPKSLKISQKHSELNRFTPRPSQNTKTNKIIKKTKR